METALKALELDPCNSFAHTVIANAYDRIPGEELPDSDTTWIHINKAVQCDSTDGNAWLFLCVEAMLRGNFELMHQSARKLKETEFLTKAVLAYGRWMMKTLPDSAIIITNGDMDTFPLLALQAADGFRTDVTVVEKQWLGLKPYLIYMRDNYRLPLQLKESKIDSLSESIDFPQNMLLVADLVFKGWLEQKASGSLSHPIAVAVTVEEDFYADVKDQLRYSGPVLLWNADVVNDVSDTLALRNSIAGIQIDDFSGPWVSNRDYSPIRIIYTKRLAGNITFMALDYSEELIRAEKYERAEEILNWAETFENKTGLGPVHFEQISELKGLAGHGRK